MKLDPSKGDTFDQGDFYWVGHPDLQPKPDSVEAKLIRRRYDLDIIGGVTDAEASYSYDDFALVELDGDYYLLNTVGCSCPSPTETWGVEIGPATKEQIREFVVSGRYEGYTVPTKQLSEFLELLK